MIGVKKRWNILIFNLPDYFTLHFFTEELCINFLPLAIHVYLHVILYVLKLVKRRKIQINF